MSKAEVKMEINKVLDTLPDSALQQLLEFLKQLENKNEPYFQQDKLFSILSEDAELLKKLAE